MPQTLTLLQILAMTMFGEAAILQDADAAMAVGHVFMNRLGNGSFGSTPELVAKGFHGFAVTSLDDVPSSFLRYANAIVIRDHDPTGGCLYILSHQDLEALVDYNWRKELCFKMLATWVSVPRSIMGVSYQLYGFTKYPTDIDYNLIRSYIAFIKRLEP